MSIALACLLIFGDRLGLAQVAGIALSLAGVLYTVLRGDLTSLMALEFNAGDLWILAAVVGWAIYTAFLRKRPAIHWLSYAFAIFLVGAVTTAPLVVAEHMSGWRLQADRTTFLAMAYVAIFPSLLSYVFFNRGVELIGGARTSAFLNLVPPMTAALAILFLGEELGLYHVIGFALILAGVTLVARGPRQ